MGIRGNSWSLITRNLGLGIIGTMDYTKMNKVYGKNRGKELCKITGH